LEERTSDLNIEAACSSETCVTTTRLQWVTSKRPPYIDCILYENGVLSNTLNYEVGGYRRMDKVAYGAAS
jgi:hypothetical protein